jgi:hypothetical protein
VFQHFHAVHTGEAQVQDDYLGAEPVKSGQPSLAAQLPGNLVSEALEVVTDTAQNVDVVIDEQN